MRSTARSGVRLPVAVIGGGPYGLSLSAHLRARGVAHRVFGRPMSSWAENMPRGMYLKSEGFASNLSHPHDRYTLREYCRLHEQKYADLGEPVALDTFVAYGRWFQRQAVPDLEQLDVVALDHRGTSFHLRLSDESEVIADRVVVATGMLPFAHLPELLADLPAGAVTHSSAHHDLSGFAGRDVTVVGGGSSALDIAAMLNEAGARPRVLVRSKTVAWNTNPLDRGLVDRVRYPVCGLGTGWTIRAHATVPDLFRMLPPRKRLKIVRLRLGPAGGWWLRDRVVGRLPLLTGRELESAEGNGTAVKLWVRDSAGDVTTLQTDHVIAATGYRVDLARLPFLAPSLRARVATLSGSPVLSRDFESSLRGLHFVGLPAAVTFGPVQRFVYGTAFTAARVSGRLARSR